MKKKHLSRKYKGTDVLCESCKTKEFQVVVGNPKSKYGCIVIHKRGCKFLKEMLKNSIEM